MTIDVENALPFFADLSGKPLQGGQIYFGAAGQNPVTNPITVYWDAAATQPVAQPVSVANGLTTRNGTPARIYVPSAYSRLVLDSSGRQVSLDASLAAPLRSDLAASGGAAIVGWIRSAAGAVFRWVSDKLAERVSVKDFGAKGDGVTDDSAAILAAVATGAKLYFPQGTYITAPFSHTAGIYGDGPEKTIIQAKAGSVGYLVSIKSTNGQYATVVSEIQLLANGAGQSGLLMNESTATVERVRCQNFDTVGIALGDIAHSSGCFWVRVCETFIVMTGGTGVLLEASPAAANANELQNVYISGTFVTGIEIRANANRVMGGTVEWRAGCVDAYKVSGHGNIIEGIYTEAVAGAQPTNLFNITGNNNTCRDIWLQASLSNSLYSKITNTGMGNRIEVGKNLRYTSYLPQSNKNYFPGPSFKRFTGTNQPYGFVNIGAGAVQDLTTTYFGNPTLKMSVAASFLNASCYLLLDANSATDYPVQAFQGRTVSISVACMTTLAGYGGLTYTILAPSGNINGDSQCTHTGSGNWEIFTDSFKVPADATQIIIALRTSRTNAAGTGDIWFAAPSVTFGRSAAALTDMLQSVNDISAEALGTFTPVVTGTTVAGVGTYTTQSGRYQRLGNRVFFEIALVWTAHTGTGNISITGLPYTSVNVSTFHVPALAVNYSNLVVGAGLQMTAQVDNNSATIHPITCDPAGGANGFVAMDAAASLWITGHYEAP